MGQVAAAIALLTLGGCDTFGSPLQVFAQKPAAPDEFQVLARKPLRMPASATLPEPRPGARSPLEPDPHRAAVVALMGGDAAPAQVPESLQGAGESAGEQALLAAAGDAASQPVRNTVKDDKKSRSSQKKGYEPPSLLELFTGSSTPKDVIDPAAEARRLQAQGVAAAPIDPNDRPAPPEEEAKQPGIPAYPSTDGRRPENKLPSSGQPKF